MATDSRQQVEVNDQEETILSTHARAAELAEAVQAARTQIEGKSRRRHAWVAVAAIVGLAAIVVALL
jgi:hypothetical protein